LETGKLSSGARLGETHGGKKASSEEKKAQSSPTPKGGLYQREEATEKGIGSRGGKAGLGLGNHHVKSDSSKKTVCTGCKGTESKTVKQQKIKKRRRRDPKHTGEKRSPKGRMVPHERPP